jgi:hypothetical protein
MPEELSREEKRAIRKAEKRKAKFGAEVTGNSHDPQTSKRSTGSIQQASRDRDVNDEVKVRALYLHLARRDFANSLFCHLGRQIKDPRSVIIMAMPKEMKTGQNQGSLSGGSVPRIFL